MFLAVAAAFAWPGTNAGRSQRGAELSIGGRGLTDAASNASVGLGTVEVATPNRTGGVCPWLASMQGLPSAEQLGEAHGEAVTRD